MTGTPILGCQSKVTTWLFEKKKGCPKAKADITSMASKASGVFLKIGYINTEESLDIISIYT